MDRSIIKRRDFLALGLAAASAPSAANAALFSRHKVSNKPIRLVVPFAPGSGTDFVGRLWAETARPHLGTLVIENQSGGAGAIGGVSVARAKPDGTTLLVAPTTAFVLEMLLKRRPVYNPVKELVPISSFAISAFVMAVNPALPVGSLKELVAYAAANPKKVTFGSAGIGSMGHLTGEMFKSLTKTPNITHVPYRGGSQLISDTVGGQISMLIAPATDQILDLHKSGKLKILAVTSPSRLIVAPEIPTAVESGVPGLVVFVFIGLFAPRGTPKSIVEHISQASRTAMADQAFQKKLIDAGYRPDPESTPEKVQQYIRQDLERWGPLIKDIGLKVD
jgi:tripartite-type tricarboxylate transporter receptor subunit TctC